MLPSVLLALGVSTAAAHAQIPAGGVPLNLDTARIDAVFAEYDSRTSPGCALGVIRDGATIYARGYGMADLERAVPITPGTIFDIGSTSKQFTAASVALLAADGRLRLDDDIRKYIPELPRYEEPITVRQLLQHTSGLRDYINVMYLGGLRFEDMTTADDALDAIVRQRALNFPPGSAHSYSNSGYFLASVLVERVSGMSLREFAEQRIFRPLGMTSTLFRDDYALIVPDRAVGYAPGDSATFAIEMSDWEQTGDGAVHTSVEDLALWDQNFYEPKVGGQPLLDHLLTTGRLDDGEPITYALGLFVDEYRGQRRVAHGGSWAGYRAQLARFPDQRVSIAVLCNLATANAGGLASDVADILLASYLEAETETAAAETSTAAPATREPALDAATLQKFTGLFFDEGTSAFRRISADSTGHLVLHISGTELALRPLEHGRFETVGYPVLIEFQATAPGEPLALTETIESDPAVSFEQVPPAPADPALLPEYAGTYDSEELATSWMLVIRDGALVLEHRALGDTRLVPAFVDAFTGGPLLLHFERGEDGRISGFEVSMGRARNIGFVRQPE